MTLRVGFLGYGFMGDAHASALARLPMFFPDAPAVERHVLVGRDEDRLADAADRLGFARTATDWERALDDADVLYNLGPNHLHVEPTIAALERDVHVLCEKPLAPGVDGAERMAAAARDSDALAGVGFNYRYVPAIQLARRLIDEGELGEIRQFRGSYLQDWLLDPEAPWSWRMDADRAGSGALGDLGAHTVDLARFLVGDVARVSGHLRTFVDERPEPDGDGTKPVTVDDAFTAQVDFAGGETTNGDDAADGGDAGGAGAMGTVEASRVAAGHKNDHAIAVHGTEGSLRFSLERLNELEVARRDARGYERILVTDESDPYVDRWWPPGHVLGWEHTFVHQSYEFLSAVADGGDYRPGFDDGLAVQRTLDAVARSDERGRWTAPGGEA